MVAISAVIVSLTLVFHDEIKKIKIMIYVVLLLGIAGFVFWFYTAMLLDEKTIEFVNAIIFTLLFAAIGMVSIDSLKK